MKNTLKAFILGSAMFAASNAMAVNQQNPQVIHNFDLSVEAWKKEIKDAHDPVVQSALSNWMLKELESTPNGPEAYRSVQKFASLELIRYFEIWNEIVTKYPDATNSRIAMCEFAKEIKLHNADKQKCNGDFIPNEKEFKKEITMKEFRNSPGFNVPMKTPKRKKI
jgi:hypothetical protein